MSEMGQKAAFNRSLKSTFGAHFKARRLTAGRSVEKAKIGFGDGALAIALERRAGLCEHNIAAFTRTRTGACDL